MPTLFLCGDVMTGRGIDQILTHPSPPRIQEPYVSDARDYVAMAQDANGPIARPVAPEYVWGDALDELERIRPDARIINLETSVTKSDDFWPGKAIHYRMHPENVACLTAAGIDVCVLANNHVLDYGRSGLDETIRTLTAAGLQVAGAGATIDRAREPAAVGAGPARRILVFAVGVESSGIPRSWAATAAQSGVDRLPDLSDRTADAVLQRVFAYKRRGDTAVVSIHWGDNWGYAVPHAHVRFAHRLLDGGADVIHGHSSHHARPIEIHRHKLVLYGCGDLITDYEGITGYERFCNDLVAMYFPQLDPDTGELLALRITPMRIRRMQLVHPSAEDRAWLCDRLAEISRDFGCTVRPATDGTTFLAWHAAS